MSTLFSAEKLPPVDYEYITSIDHYSRFIQTDLGYEWLSSKVWGVDIETSALHPTLGDIVTIQVAHTNAFAVVFDVHKIGHAALTGLLNPSFSRKKLVAHNAAFESMWFEHYGYTFRKPLFDTMLASQLYSCGHKHKHSLVALVSRYLGYTLPKDEQTSFKAGVELRTAQKEYAARDAAVLIDLRNILIPKLADAGLLEVAKIEFDAVPGVAEMTRMGVLYDWDKIESSLVSDLESAVHAAEETFWSSTTTLDRDLFGQQIRCNLASPKQAKELLERETNISLEGTGKDYLSLLDDPTGTLQRYLAISKLTKKAGMARDMKKYRNPNTDSVHSSFNQLRARTGRVSSSNPNMQQVPRGKEFREIVIARPGRKLVVADYSQIELRIIAELSDDPLMISTYRNDEDIHTRTGALCNNVTESEVTKNMRTAAKAINFGLSYGMGAPKLKMYARTNYGVDMSTSEAEQFVEAFFSSYTGIKDWHRRINPRNLPRVPIYSRTLSGRRRFLQESDRKLSTYANNPVQGTGADIQKYAIGLLFDRTRDMDCRLVLQVHDEIMIEVAEDQAEEAAHLLETTMIEAGERFLTKVPCKVEAAIGNSWAEAK